MRSEIDFRGCLIVARKVIDHTNGALFEPTRETINGIEQLIRWAEVETPESFMLGMDKLARNMAVINQVEAKKLSYGPYDPGQAGKRYEYTGRTFSVGSGGEATPVPQWKEHSMAAWKIPVRRISGNYYASWKVRQRRLGWWELYNDSREAYFIEFGINWRGEGRRVRRPIRKLSLKRTLTIMMATTAYHRVWADIFSSPRHRHRGLGFYQIVQSPGGAHGKWEDMDDREIAGTVRRYQRTGGTGHAGIRMRRGRMQKYVLSKGGGTYGGPLLGRKLPQ